MDSFTPQIASAAMANISTKDMSGRIHFDSRNPSHGPSKGLNYHTSMSVMD